LNGLRDSKVLPAGKREKLAAKVRERALCFALGAASTREIDRFNIRVASAIAMKRAIRRVMWILSVTRPGEYPPESFRIIIDGLPLPEIGYTHEALIDGDAHCASIAAAACVAKTVRDELMCRLAVRYPGYGWETNVGYATDYHCKALDRLGPTRHHRLTFEPISQLKLF
jgi:ribonuclease HII